MDSLPRRLLPKFNNLKHYLGTPCKRQHLFEDTGLTVRHKKHGNCVECTRLSAKEWKAKYPERAKENTKRRDKKRGRPQRNAWADDNPLAVLVGGARKRSRLLGIEPTITPDYMRELWMLQGGKCYWTGFPMVVELDPRHPLKPSIDRIQPEKGYTIGNVVWCTNFANRARGDSSTEEFAIVIQKIKESLIAYDRCDLNQQVQKDLFIGFAPIPEATEKIRGRKINPEIVLEIYRRSWAGEKTQQLSDAFDISPTTVSEIKHGRKWQDITLHVQPKYNQSILSQEQIDAIYSLKDSKLSVRSISKIVGCAHQTVSKYLRKTKDQE